MTRLPLAICLVLALRMTGALAEPISFEHDVVAVFSKAGCNNGGCHGNANGRGAFKLSLRGESPHEDFRAITQNKASRLVVSREPEKSLLVRKPTRQIGHEGGERFGMNSPEYKILLAWIQQGASDDPPDAPKLVELRAEPRERVVIAPENSVKIRVTARFSDGSERDVSRWAVYEPSDLIVDIDENGYIVAKQTGETTIAVRYLQRQQPVRLAFVPARPDFRWEAPEPANRIDDAVFAKLRRLRMNPSERCDDATFIRRVSLDLTGLVPAEKEAKAFIGSSDPDKRAHLVDQLLVRPAFADFWALKWSDLLRNEENTLDEKGVRLFHGWIRQSIAENKPLDQFARELVTGIGSSYENPPSNYYRALRKPTLRAEATAQLFLGTRLQCARCHHHPYERWSQDDYYQFAAVFDGMDYKIIENRRRDEFDKNQFIGEQLIQVGLERKLKDPRSNKHPPPAFLPIPGMPERSGDDLEALGDWLTVPDNPLFARVQVNRVWFQLFGQGIVDPVDDFRSTNPPVNPELLSVLEHEFIESGFDLRHIIRFITMSETYQRSAVPNATNRDDDRNFSHALVQRFSAEVLLDAMHQVLGTSPRFTDIDRPLRAIQLPGIEGVHRNRKPKRDEHFLKLFGRPVRLLNSDLERSNATSLAQVFEMVSGRAIHEILARSDNRLGRLLASGAGDEEIVETLYWSALTRAPSKTEAKEMVDYLGRANDRRRAVEDLAWALLNSKEFMLRQ